MHHRSGPGSWSWSWFKGRPHFNAIRAAMQSPTPRLCAHLHAHMHRVSCPVLDAPDSKASLSTACVVSCARCTVQSQVVQWSSIVREWSRLVV
ncbi:hypothetical protein IE81DRAFT_101820 [Ceraceosorus guamensis]|uniref:Uncharacterized protein n=1 Tax=Ceraceosorus guamensis TaxID=1522189 RepID=A0A316W039_9BASI|nr:hypothetical protein IE81DRAFT_101820 [Ceraceosorus guamensis]PWN43049.1 hypothetical protein IE81DRAFT_101820 [Ceraceosorus guamensis]